MLEKINFQINFEGRVFGLDLLRAFAIFTVVYCHGYTFLSQVLNEKTYMYFFINGVTVFFVLSGYLVGTIFIKQIDPRYPLMSQLWHFWKRRWWRTLPNYFLILTFLVVYFDRMHGYAYYHSIKYFFFCQNLFQPHPAFFGEAWSLAVEEWFYFLLPLVFLFFHQSLQLNKQAAMKWLLLVFILLPLCSRIIFHFMIPACNVYYYDHYFSKLVFMRLDSIMIGVAGAYWQAYHPKSWHKAKSLWWAGLLLILLVHGLHVQQAYASALFCFIDRTMGLSIMPLGVLLLIPFLSTFHPKKLHFGHKCIMTISLISYSMYLINLTLFKSILGPLFDLLVCDLSRSIELYSYLKYMYYWILLIMLSYLLYILWERPMTSLRD